MLQSMLRESGKFAENIDILQKERDASAATPVLSRPVWMGMVHLHWTTFFRCVEHRLNCHNCEMRNALEHGEHQQGTPGMDCVGKRPIQAHPVPGSDQRVFLRQSSSPWRRPSQLWAGQMRSHWCEQRQHGMLFEGWANGVQWHARRPGAFHRVSNHVGSVCNSQFDWP